MMIFHGFAKIKGGPELWCEIGGKIGVLGINFLPVFWGFMAGFAEFFCSFLIILGVLFRPAIILLALTMVAAVFVHLNMPPENPASRVERCFTCSGTSSCLYWTVLYGAWKI